MAFSAVAWAYKDVITSTKLAQMVENTRAHDHRSDGTQGSPFAWTDYVPTSGNIGNPTVNRCRYTAIGSTVIAQGRLTLNGVAAGTISVGLPVARHASYGARDAIGTAIMTDVSTGQTYMAEAYPNPGDATTMLFRSHGNNDAWRADLPAAWAAGDFLSYEVTYEKA